MFWNYLTIIYICWETSTDMKTHIIQYKSFTHDNSWKPVIKRISMIRSIAFHPKAMNDINNNGRSSDLFPL